MKNPDMGAHGMRWVVVAAAILMGGCMGGPSRAGRSIVSAKVMGEYLAKSELDTPTIRAGATSAVTRGTAYREHVRDQRGRWALVTIWMDAGERNMLHIKTKRDITCPRCNGSGARSNIGRIPDVGVTIRCPQCKGSGIMEGHIEEKRYIIGEPGGREFRDSRFPAAPAGALPAPPRAEEEQVSPMVQQRLDDLASKDARVRIAALEWLDRNYVRKGVFFQRYMPFLRKARWIETDNVTNLTVYQFHAGLEDVPSRAHYRVYVDVKSGNIQTVGFFAREDPAAQKPKESILRKATGLFH